MSNAHTNINNNNLEALQKDLDKQGAQKSLEEIETDLENMKSGVDDIK